MGSGTPGPWDAPRRVVAVGPYRWVRNPIYLAALVAVAGEAWLFLSVPVRACCGVMAIVFHLFVIGYEEPTLSDLRRLRAERAALAATMAPTRLSRPCTESAGTP